FLRPSVLERDGAIEHQLSGRAVLIEREVGEALELVTQLWLRVHQARLALGGYDFERVRVEVLSEVSVGIRLGHGEEAVVKPALGVNRVRGADPVDRALDLT